mmetsp:Transcript_65314/g.141792  ORF Transcript_65314/g.141792 Transcript_65314/m.141792 type:complete len:199 (-) Transcript_65314:126-722(-)
MGHLSLLLDPSMQHDAHAVSSIDPLAPLPYSTSYSSSSSRSHLPSYQDLAFLSGPATASASVSAQHRQQRFGHYFTAFANSGNSNANDSQEPPPPPDSEGPPPLAGPEAYSSQMSVNTVVGGPDRPAGTAETGVLTHMFDAVLIATGIGMVVCGAFWEQLNAPPERKRASGSSGTRSAGRPISSSTRNSQATGEGDSV